VEADLLLQVLGHLKNPNTLAQWVREQDARAMREANLEDLGIGTPETVLAAARERLHEIAQEREVVNRQERKGRLSEEEADKAHEALGLEEAEAHHIVVRQQAALARRHEFVASFEELISWPGYSLSDLGTGGQRENLTMPADDRARRALIKETYR